MTIDFHTIANPPLGTLVGLLIGLPVMAQTSPFFLLLFGILGGVIGYRWRSSRLFMYFSAVLILILSGLLMQQGEFSIPHNITP